MKPESFTVPSAKRIYVLSTSTAIADKAVFKRGLGRLRRLGHSVEVDEAALARSTRFAGDDETRLGAIHRAVASGADVVLGSRGGYGMGRLLPQIPYKAIAKQIERGQLWLGFSDWTPLQLALLHKTGAHSWQSPMVVDDFGPAARLPDGSAALGREADADSAMDDIMLACFDDLLSGRCEGAGWALPKPGNRFAFPTRGAGLGPVEMPERTSKNTSKIAANNARGCWTKSEFHLKKQVLWGGNLSTLAAMVGTPYMPSIDGILWFEDVAEHPYRLERMLIQLLQSGVLQRQKAIIFGQFSRYEHMLGKLEGGYKLQTVVDWLRQQIKCPVLTGLPFGHVPTKVCLPQGVKTDLIVQGGEAILYWG